MIAKKNWVWFMATITALIILAVLVRASSSPIPFVALSIAMGFLTVGYFTYLESSNRLRMQVALSEKKIRQASRSVVLYLIETRDAVAPDRMVQLQGTLYSALAVMVSNEEELRELFERAEKGKLTERELRYS